MSNLASVPQPSDSDDEPQVAAGELAQAVLFEGEVISRSRIDPGSVGNFACLDLDTMKGLILNKRDRVVVQFDAEVTEVRFVGGYTKPSDRIHMAKVIDGSQAIVKVQRRET